MNDNTLEAQAWRILHIDDDEDDHILVKAMLAEAKGRKIKLDWAATYDEGHEKLCSSNYHAVLIDYDLGLRTGIELIRKFVDQGYAAPMILLTGRGSYDVDVEAMHAGATLYLSKNEINALLLERSIRYAVERKQDEQELRKTTQALQERDKKLSVALEAAQLGAWTYTFADQMLEVDERARQLYRADSQCVSHDHIVENFLHPDDVQPMLDALKKAADPKGDGRYQMVYRILQPDGSPCWLNVWGLTEFEGEGENRRPVRLIGASRDITEHVLSAQSLRLSDERFQLASKAVSGVLYDLSIDRNELYQSEGLERVVGYRPGEEPGGTKDWWPRSIHPDDYPNVKAALAAAMQSGAESFAYEYRIRHRDGHWVYIWDQGLIVRGEDGKAQRMVGICTDITERKQVEEQQAFHASLLDNLNDAIIATDLEFRVTAWNKAAEALYGYTAQEALGKKSSEVQVSEINPEQRDDLVRQVLENGSGTIEVVHHNKDGRRLVIKARVIPQRDNNGKVVGFVSANRDITLHKKVSHELQESESRFRDMANNISQLAWMANETGWISWYNQRWFDYTGATLEEMQGWGWQKVFHPDHIERVLKEYKRCLSTGEPWEDTFPLRSKDGEYRWFLSRAVPIKDENGHVERWFGTNTDITEQKQADSQARILAGIVEHSSSFIGLCTPDWIPFFLNAYGREMVGLDGDSDISQTHVMDYFWPEDLPMIEQEAVPTLLRDGRWLGEVRFRHFKTGEPIYTMWNAFVIKDDAGQPIAFATVSPNLNNTKQTENALEVERAKLAAAIENMPVGVVIADANGNILSMNQVGLKLHGFASQGEMFSRLDRYFQEFDLFYPDGQLMSVEERPASKALRSEFVQNYEVRLYNNLNGTELPVSYSTAPVRSSQGELILIVFLLQDLTEMRQAVEDLERHRTQLRAVLNSLAEGVLIIDHQGYFLDANPTAIQILGSPDPVEAPVKPEEFMSYFEVMSLDGMPLPEAEWPIARLARGETFIGQEVIIRHKDNGKEWTGSFNGKPVLNQAGELVWGVFTMRDITQQKQAEKALLESESSLRQLADAMPHLVWTARSDGVVEYYNQRYTLYGGTPPDDDGHRKWQLLIHPDDLQPTVDAWEEAVRAAEVFQMEHRLRIADGSYRWHLSRAVPVFDEDRRLVKWFGTATDIHDFKQVQTELAEYIKRLKRSNEELENFAFVASHDLQEPLRKIKMFGDSLKEKLEGELAGSLSEETVDYLERMQNASERMQAMIDGLLDLSRVNTRGKAFQVVDLGSIVEEVVSDLEVTLQTVGGQVIIEPLPAVEGDPMQLRRLMQNLIGNGLKFHKEGVPPIVRVSAEVTSADETGEVGTNHQGNKDHQENGAGEVRISVVDNGIGFDEAYLDRLFQPFVRLLGRSEYEGSGMGLAICRKIVDRHGGSISARSKPGEGSQFIVVLPVKR